MRELDVQHSQADKSRGHQCEPVRRTGGGCLGTVVRFDGWVAHPDQNCAGQAVGEVDGTQIKDDGQGAARQVQVIRVAQGRPEGP